MTVVKLGGSLLAGNRLGDLCAVISTQRAPVAVVPGGGPFADAVRSAQAGARFDDATAHCMALLAMAQMAFAIAASDERFVVTGSPAETRAVLDERKVAVWAPLDLVADRSQVEESWRVTSDSLALHHAAAIGACRVVLVKARPHEAACPTGDLVDAAFAGMLQTTGLDAWWIGDGDADRLEQFLAADSNAAIRFTGGGY